MAAPTQGSGPQLISQAQMKKLPTFCAVLNSVLGQMQAKLNSITTTGLAFPIPHPTIPGLEIDADATGFVVKYSGQAVATVGTTGIKTG